jgi:pyridoxamine 5'-phosphate oxidase
MDDLKSHIKKLREDFMKGELSEESISKDPFAQFTMWLEDAKESMIPEFQAMNLATVSNEGKPSSRIVYLRELEGNKFWFYTNYLSKKSKELELNPNACLLFFWPELERQVRIEGTVTRAEPAASDAYFASRPFDSRIGAWSSEQSLAITSREELEKKFESFKKQFNPETIKRPEFWGGLVLQANYYEFWQGRKSRLHDRISFSMKNNQWNIQRLAP